MRGDMDGWTIILLDDDAGFTLFPNTVDGWLEYQSYPARDQNIVDRDRSARDETIYYWQAPIKYYGNRVGLAFQIIDCYQDNRKHGISADFQSFGHSLLYFWALLALATSEKSTVAYGRVCSADLT